MTFTFGFKSFNTILMLQFGEFSTIFNLMLTSILLYDYFSIHI